MLLCLTFNNQLLAENTELDADNHYRGRIRWLRMANQSNPHIELPRARKEELFRHRPGKHVWNRSFLLSLFRLQETAPLRVTSTPSPGGHIESSKNSVLSLRDPAGGSSLPCPVRTQATTRPMRGQHSHGTHTPCTLQKHRRVAVQEPTPFLIVKTHLYFSSIKTIIMLLCQLEVSY